MIQAKPKGKDSIGFSLINIPLDLFLKFPESERIPRWFMISIIVRLKYKDILQTKDHPHKTSMYATGCKYPSYYNNCRTFLETPEGYLKDTVRVRMKSESIIY